MAQFSARRQDWFGSISNSNIFEVTMLTNKDGNIVDSDNPLPVSIGGESITITGDVTIPGTISVTSDTANPIHNHITQVGTGDILTVDYLPIGGTVALDSASLAALENINATVSGSVSVSNFPATQTVDGIVGIAGDVNVTQGTDPWVISGTVNANIVGSAPPGSSKPFYLEVQQGLIPGYQFNHKFGAAPSMAATTATVWDLDDTLYPWDALGSGSIVNVERNDTDDNGFIVTVQGLDENYEFAEEEITITGANQVGSQLFTRVNRAFISDTGTTNEGNIDIEAAAAGGTTVARITAGYGQTLMAVYTIPAGKTAYLINMACTGSSDTDASGSIRKREFGSNTFRIQHTFELQIRGGQYNYTFGAPLVFSEKTDIEIRIVNRSNNKRITSAFDVLLVDN